MTQTMTKNRIRHEVLQAESLRLLPPSLRKALRAACTKGMLEFSLSKNERRVWRTRPFISNSAWAERYRVVHMSSRPGRWRNSTTPYSAGLMDASWCPSVRTVVLCKVPQSGGSEAILNCLAYAIDRVPGPAIMVYPDENMARENATDRIIPMIESTPALSLYRTQNTDDLASLRIKLTHMLINMAWSGSPSRLGNKPARYLVNEEIDKWKNNRTETSSLELARRRLTTYAGLSKEWDVCTPTTEQGAIWQELLSCDAVYDYHVTCPHCKYSQLMSFEGIHWGEEPDPKVVRRKKLARYQCSNPECGTLWSDAERNLAVLRGGWKDRDTQTDLLEHIKQEEPEKIGFHLPAWLSPFVSLSEIASAWLRYQQSGSLDDLKNFKTQYCAVPWVEPKQGRTYEQILHLCDDRPRGRVPGPGPDGQPRVACLVAGVDTQGTYLRYVVRAVGYGENPERWLIQSGSVADFNKLEDLLFHSEWTDPSGTPYTIALTVQDAMGHRTYEVYEMCARYKGLIVPYQGLPRGSAPVRYSLREYYPGTKAPIKGGINLLRVDTNYFKSHLAAMLGVAPGDPGAYSLHSRFDAHSKASLLDDYAHELTAESYDNEKMKWICPKGVANHFWDCEAMASVAEYELDVKHWPLPGSQEEAPAPKKKRTSTPKRNRF